MGPRPPRASGGSRSRRRIGEGFGARRRQRSGGGGSSDESTTNNSEEEFEARKKRSEARLRGAIRPIGGRGAASLAGGATVVGEGGARVLGPAVGDVGARGDVQPMAIEAGGGWSKVGGLEGHVKAIKEMVLMPLLYPHVFASLGVTPPRGVLLHGPPGTGKTLVARALAQSCCAAGRSVNFFMRKGADVLSKWVGEAEKQLRLLFEEATRLAPSIIFFDEIDGLAPVRSSKQDYIHASIVSTLLALMDGLDSRGQVRAVSDPHSSAPTQSLFISPFPLRIRQVILIGATNRIDSLDAALRRPGRFDRELQFALPSSKDREAILRIHTDAWQPPPAVELLSELAARTHGFCGADLKALCAEAALRRLRATFPQVFEEEERYEIDAKGIVVLREDFLDALSIITPAAQRSVSLAASPLPPHLVPLLARPLEHALDAVKAIFPPLVHADGARSAFRGAGAPLAVDVGGVPYHTVCRPRLLLHGPPGNGQTPLALAILHALEHCHLYSLELAALTSAGHSSIAEACARVLAEARRTPPAVVLLPSADTWLSCADTMLFATLASMLDALPAGCPMLFLGTSDAHLEQVDELTASRLRALFPADVLEVGPPCVAARERMFRKLSADAAASPAPPSKKTVARPRKLRKAPPLPPPEPSPAEIAARRAARVASEREMRACLREVCFVLGSDRRFREWARPVDPSTEAGAEYVEVVGAPMELARLLERVNGRTVTCRSAFEAHLRRIVECAEAFYGADGSRGAAMGLADPMRPIANAHTLLDEALELLDEIDPKLVEEAEALAAAQARAGHAQADPKSKQRLGASKLPADAQIDDAQPGGQRAAASGSASAARPQGDGADGIAASDAAMARRARAEHRARLSPTRDEASIAVAEPPVAPAQCGPADEEPSLSELPVAISNMDNAISELGETVDRPNGGADVIDAEALEEWVASYVQRVVEATEGWSVGEVEALALDLWKCVHAHHSKPSEGQLRSDLQGGLERHISRCKSRKEKC